MRVIAYLTFTGLLTDYTLHVACPNDVNFIFTISKRVSSLSLFIAVPFNGQAAAATKQQKLENIRAAGAVSIVTIILIRIEYEY